MVELLEAAGFVALLFLLACPVVWAWRFALLFPPRGEPPVAEAALPRAAVILSLRGADPSLDDCLAGLLNLDYPAYALWIIIDSREDPAWGVVHEYLASTSAPKVPVNVRVLDTPRETCSLKMSALTQALAEASDSCEVVALIDADVIPHRDWLRALVRPLLDPGTGASTGVRWYTPQATNWGTLVRYVWNAGACSYMHAFRIAWGGSLAFRTEVLRTSGLPEQWSRSFCEDTGSNRVLRQHGLRLRMVPEATMVSTETIGLKGCLTFFRRQLVCVRLHHERWRLLAAANWGTGLALATAVVGLGAALVSGCWTCAAWLAGAVACYAVGLVSALVHVERGIRGLARTRGQEVRTLTSCWRAVLALPLALAVHLACLAAASRLRRIDWRGISYELGGGGKVRLIEYRPYRPPAQAADRSASVT